MYKDLSKVSNDTLLGEFFYFRLLHANNHMSKEDLDYLLAVDEEIQKRMLIGGYDSNYGKV